ncbi:hypothetical protein K2D_46050 [Planctomycetes bacterium K2D]|uniref:Uncharacterized protein n=1 Tax=Botrimarina mediterranea TaxID=2528022 RepID=A0A518KF20_9BACT|nr:hypothetical protein Spa11_46030 [Botrimarina mediterranea]QDV80970.1 hypothetical protein K2D_46050 [Planctomycetes bacterium K2D]
MVSESETGKIEQSALRFKRPASSLNSVPFASFLMSLAFGTIYVVRGFGEDGLSGLQRCGEPLPLGLMFLIAALYQWECWRRQKALCVIKKNLQQKAE